MNSLFQDMRYAFRQLRKSPGFTATALATLAIGLGAAASVYTVIQSVLLSPLPYTNAGELAGIGFTFPSAKPNDEQAGSSADFVRSHTQAFSSTAIMDDSSYAVNLSINGGRAVQVNSQHVSEGYFRTLGAMPAVGRVFTQNEDVPGGAKAVILSDGLWSSIFQRDPTVVGRAIRINQETYTVTGVMPKSFAVAAETASGAMIAPDLWVPLQLGPKDPGYEGDNYEMIGRLRPGVTLAHAQMEIAALAEPFYQEFPTYKTWVDGAQELHQFKVWRLQDVVVSDVRSSLLTMMGAVVAVLLISCLNLAGLMTARSMRRSREFALRSALGASRAHLVRLMLSEGVLLALCGGGLALLVARGLTTALLHSTPLAIPDLRGGASSLIIAMAVVGFALASVCIFSLLPAWAVLRERVTDPGMRATGIGDTASSARFSRLLLVAQVALATVLLSTASVLVGTFLKLQSLPSGVEPKMLSVFQVALKGDRYANTEQTNRFVTSVLDDLRHTPGVDRVAAINGLPLDRGLNMGGYPAGRPEEHRIIELRTVTPDYFQTMGIVLLAGRDVSESDRLGTDPVIIIGESAARKFWPGRSPIGESFRIGNEQNWRVVGVAADVHTRSLVETGDVVIYAPMAQLSNKFTGIVNNWFPTSFAIRTEANVNLAAAAQRAIERADPEIPVARLTSMQAVIDSTIQEPRFYTVVAGAFSGFALLLTVIGIYGLLSYQVTQRTREIGVRMALGADRAQILISFLWRGLVLTAVGTIVGLAASWLTSPAVHHLLADAGVGSQAGSQIVLNGVQAAVFAALALLLAALAASWVPARRAASIEPMEALRSE